VLGVEPDYPLYSKVLSYWTQVRNVAATLPVIFTLQGGSRGGGCDLWEPPWWGIGGSTLKAKNRCKISL